MISIKTLTDPIPYAELVAILQDSFAERVKSGLNFACAFFDKDDLKNHLSIDTKIIGAYMDEELVGMVVLDNFAQKFGFCYATHKHLAIANKAKRKGIASVLLRALIKEANKLKLDFILSDTASGAESSVKYHSKNGFLIYGNSHYPGRNYESINYILPLTTKGKLISSPIGRKILGLIFSNK